MKFSVAIICIAGCGLLILLLFQSIAVLYCSVAGQHGFVADGKNSVELLQAKHANCSELQDQLNQTVIKVLDIGIGYTLGKSIGR